MIRFLCILLLVMADDFNAFGSSRFNAFQDSGYDARKRDVIPFTLRFWFGFFEFLIGNINFVVPLFGSQNWGINAVGNFLGTGGITLYGGAGSVSHGSEVLSTLAWNYFVCGYDGEKLFCQLNSGSRYFTILPPLVFGPGFNLRLSPNQWNDPAWGKPRIDEVAFWKNRVLTEAEAADDRDNEDGFAEVSGQDGLLAYWEMAGVAGIEPTVLTDSLNGYTLNRSETGTGSIPGGLLPIPHPAYDAAGKIGTGLQGANESGYQTLGYQIATYFATGSVDFTFGG